MTTWVELPYAMARACVRLGSRVCHPVYNDVGVVKADGGVDAPQMRHFALEGNFPTRGSSPIVRRKPVSPPIYSVCYCDHDSHANSCSLSRRQAAHSSARCATPHHRMTRARLH